MTSKFMNTETLNNIMTTAIEGGSAYWMNDDDVCRNVEVKRDADHNIVEITCETEVDGDGWKKHTITHTQIRKALTELKDDQKQNDHWRKFARSFLFDREIDYDAGDADVFVQYAMFQDIVFG